MSDTTDPQPATVSQTELYLLAESMADQLGVWNVVDDYEDGQDNYVHLIAPDRRAIGLRLLFNGRAAQTFAVGGTTPTPPAGTDKAVNANRLAEGVRYSTGVMFTPDGSPLESILTAVRTVLLPAFDGHRPLLNSRGRRPAPEPATDPAEPTGATEQAAKPAPKSRARKSTTKTKEAKPARRTRKKATTAAS